MSFAMKYWIENLTRKLFVIIFFSMTAIPCSLKENTVSLSGPLNFYFLELELHQDSKLKAVSLYHDFLHNKFKGKWIGGGIYLSTKELSKIGLKYDLYLDESFELEQRIQKIKKKVPEIRSVHWVKSKGKSSLELIKKLESTIKKITRNCDEKLSVLRSRVSKISTEILNFKFLEKTHLFYLGMVKGEKTKNIMVANDLFVLNLKQNKSFKGYKTDLAYLEPSSKNLKSLRDKSIYIGLNSSKDSEFKFIEYDKNSYNLFYRGLLVPGLSQIYFISEFLGFYEDVLKLQKQRKASKK